MNLQSNPTEPPKPFALVSFAKGIALHGGDSNRRDMASLDADLQRVIEAWSKLPDMIRSAMLLFVTSHRA